MPNIAFINYCNLSCPYCFANEFIEEKKQLISEEQLKKILNFLKLDKQNKTKIGIIGGEPTLHPDFKKLLLLITQQYYQTPVVFTNGIELSKYAKFFINDAKALINVNEPKIIGETKWLKLNNSLDLLFQLGAFDKDNITLGINIYLDIKDFDYIFNLAIKYNQNHIRCSCVAPCNEYANILNKEEYYNNIKPLFLKLVNIAKKNNIKINLDCNNIPLCFFNDNEKELIIKQCDGFHSFCTPVIDITPDFRATSCFGCYNPIDLNNFDNLQEVERYMYLHEMYPKTLLNKTEKCISCHKFNNLSCQGGCLAFAKNNLSTKE